MITAEGRTERNRDTAAVRSPRRPVRSLNERPRLSWWDGRVRSLLFDLLTAVVVVLAGVACDGALTAPAVCSLVAAAPAFAVRRRFPWLPVAAAAVLAFVGAPGAPAMVAVYTFARRRGPCVGVWTAGGITAVAVMSGTQGTLAGFGARYSTVLLLLVVGVPMLLGLGVFQRGMLLATLRERAELTERERDLLAERAVATERRRIAREMHDVVAHRVSVISLQSGGLSVTAPDAHTCDVAEIIRSTSATALTEMRAMLRVLGDDESGGTSQARGEIAADPTVGSIRTLAEDAAASGADIRLDMPDPLPQLPGTVSRAARRIVQEALTNAAKHAPHAAVHVMVEAADGQLTVSVSNGRGRSTEGETVQGAGYGLIGMRERVTLSGGTLRTGRTDDGGYRVRAVFPLRTDEVVV